MSSRGTRRRGSGEDMIGRLVGLGIGPMGLVFGWFVCYVALVVTILTGTADIIGRALELFGGIAGLGIGGIVSFIVGVGPFLAVAYLGEAHDLPMDVLMPAGTFSLANAPLFDGVFTLTVPAVLVITGMLAGIATEGSVIMAPIYATITACLSYLVATVVVLVVSLALYNFVLVPIGVVTHRATVGVSLIAILRLSHPSIETTVMTLAQRSGPLIAGGAVGGVLVDAFFGPFGE